MTPKHKALSQLARLALNAVSDKPLSEQLQASETVALALEDDLPDLARLARSHAAIIKQQDIHQQALFESLEF